MTPPPSNPPAAPTVDISPYMELVRRFPLVPIRDDEHLDRAMEMICELGGREVLAESEELYQHVLGNLIEIYEDEHVPLPNMPGREMLRHLIESRDLTTASVAQATGLPAEKLDEMIAGSRPIGPAAMKKLGKYFEISPAVFL